jgi:ribosome-binding protein aMBF1 (putative translation factor)
MAVTTVALKTDESLRVISESRKPMAHADLRKPETRDFQAEIGQCLFRARSWVGWNLEQLAAALKRDPRQVRRWEAGEERTQVDVVMGVLELRQPFALQIARLAGARVTHSADFEMQPLRAASGE